ncbi:hypothetical protein OC834_002042 [Tilletia horrida]|uniref:Uncharacterized protein n=1 Tax=Tilletia horrida TaxID=155126 RepID=A0AAN6GCR8_9BASI|nr:hypothetical protein OC834_002042 [Tilletia horrida]KAK0534185.1 hypothetical protein OC842_002718 [Tilletia horrida]
MPAIDPSLALELRVRLLEILVGGSSDQPFQHPSSETATPLLSHGHLASVPSVRTLSARSAKVTQILHATVKENGSLASFVRAYDKNFPFLTPGFALNEPGSNPCEDDLRESGLEVDSAKAQRGDGVESGKSDAELDTGEQHQLPLSALALPPQAQAALLLEVEPELRALERQLAECEVLEQRGTAGPGKLGDAQTLGPQLKSAWEQHEKRKTEIEQLERQLSDFFQEYTSYTDAASQVFIAWDDMLTGLELRVSKAEKERLEDA